MKFSTCKGIITVLLFLLAAGQSQAQTIDRGVLVEALRDGGFVIVMRHANSPRQLPDAATANPGNVNRERQLDETGRRDAMAMGESLRRLRIPVGEILSSPTYRALETARLMGFDDVQAVEELSNEGMQAAGAQKAAWLAEQVATTTDAGNRLLITHAPNMSAAFPEYSEGMTEGEALIFDPRGMGGPVMIQRITISDWVDL